MARVGVILETMGDRARVTTALRGACEDCESGGSCSVSGTPEAGPAETVIVRNGIGARRGDTVQFDLAGHAELQLSLIVWGLPMVGLIGGAMVGGALHGVLGLGTDPAAVLGAGVGFAVSFGLVRAIDRRLAGDRRLEPDILKVVQACGAEPAHNGWQVSP